MNKVKKIITLSLITMATTVAIILGIKNNTKFKPLQTKAAETETIVFLDNYTFERNFYTDSYPEYNSTIKGNYTLNYFKKRETANDPYTYTIRLSLNFNQCATTAFNNGQQFRLNNLDTNNGQIFVFEKSNQIGFTDFRFGFEGLEYIQTDYPTDDYFQFKFWLEDNYNGYEIYNAYANPDDPQINISYNIGWNLYSMSQATLIDVTATVNYQIGQNVGYTNGYNTGHSEGFQEGYIDGEQVGYQNGYNDGDYHGYQTGYIEGEQLASPIDVAGMMFKILSMPFTFISQAFNVTLWPNTQYEINFANVIKGLIAIATILFIIKIFTSGFSIVGNYTGKIQDTRVKRSQVELNRAKADLARRTDPNKKERVST